MKKFFRLTALAVACILLALSLCSCRYIDEQRAAQAFYREDKSEIEFDGAVYRQMNIGSKYHPVMDMDAFFYDRVNYFVTEKDVPVLLGSMYGDTLIVNDRQTTLETYGHYNMFSDDYDTDVHYFFREDICDRVKDVMINGALDHYCFEYYHYADEDDYTTYEHVVKTLDDELTAAFNKALAAPREEMIGYQQLPSYPEVLVISSCDKDMLIEYAEKPYYIIRDGDDFYVWDGSTTFPDHCIAQIADDDAGLFRKLFKEHADAVNEEDILWYFEDDYTNYGVDYGSGEVYIEDSEII